MSTSEDTDGALESIEQDSFRYERAPDERPSRAVVTAVAEATGKPSTPHGVTRGEDALPPLYERLDPDALDAVVESAGDRETDVSMEFTYHDHTVTVRKWTVTVSPA